MSKLISIVIPAYNEAENIPFIYKEIKNVFLNIPYECEMIFVNDGSIDNTQEVLKSIANKDEQVKYLEFSRNFGKEMATTAGINKCNGDACIMIDADLQHPIELIPEFIAKWGGSGVETVIGIRKKNNGEGLIKRLGSFLFYGFMNRVGKTKIIPNATDFRLIDRKIINEFNKFTERNRITRGLLDWLGFKKDFVYFEANKRARGEVGYSAFKLFGLTIDTLVGHSLFLLKLVGKLGVVIILLSGSLGLFIFVEKYILNDPWGMSISGSAILAIIILFLVGVILACLGLTSLYIGNIQNEVMNRPLYVIRDKNISKKSKKQVVVVSGYFNPVHIGHLKLFKDAKKLGDYLVVIINNDRQVKLKGSVPFMPVNDRAKIVNSIQWVDEVFVSIDKDKSVCKSLRAVNPDIFANGGDRNEGNIPEVAVCEEFNIEIVDNVGGDKLRSSSVLIKEAAKLKV